MSNNSLATSHSFDPNSARPAPVAPLPPHVDRKIAAIERYGVIWARRLSPTADLLCFGDPRGSESGATTLQKRVDFLEWFVLPALDFHSTPEAQGAR